MRTNRKPVIVRFDPPDGVHLIHLIPAPRGHSPVRTLTSHYFNYGLLRCIVPAGFGCDLASIPWPVLWLFGGAFGRHQRAGLLHDYLYRVQPDGVDRRQADAILASIARVDGMRRWQVTLMFWAVRAFGSRAWARNAKDSARDHNRKAWDYQPHREGYHGQ